MSDRGSANVNSTGHEPGGARGGGAGDASVETVVMMAESVVEQVRCHGNEDTSREQGGVLVGTVAAARDRDKVYITVEAAIPAPQTRASRTSVTFTHESWGEINRAKDADYPNQDIVGWYHTHPGFGIFMSEYDTFIHRNFFPAPWQLAFVLDPIADEAGVFVWQDEQIVRGARYNVFRAEQVAAPEPQVEVPALEVDRAVPAAPRPANALVVAALLVLALQVVTLLMLLRPAPPAVGGGEAVVGRLEAVQGELATSTAALQELAERLGEAAETAPAAVARAAEAKYEWYEVKPGDSLWKIAERHYGKGELYTLIAAENGVALSTGLVVPGQRLRLPILPEGSDAGGE